MAAQAGFGSESLRDSRADIVVVIPAVRAEPVRRLLAALGRPFPVTVVWDAADEPPDLGEGVHVVRGPRRGPAAARNAGWRASEAQWIAFLDDDVVPAPDWAERARDDAGRGDVVTARIDVPVPAGRPATDWERNVARLADARFITADVLCRRAALEAIGGFDERFRRAYREDTDLELRLLDAGFTIAPGSRRTEHPVLPAPFLQSVRLQRGNADDVLAWALHGARSTVTWRFKARHAATTLTLATALIGRSRPAAAAWLAATAQLAWLRIAPGPRTADEVARMVVTSAAIPPAATLHLLAGAIRHRQLVLRHLAAR